MQLVLFVLIVAAVVATRQLIARRGRSSRVAPIGACSDGALARVIGAVGTSGQPMFAPRSRRPCVCWRVTIARLEAHDGRLYWRQVVERSRRARFVVIDRSGTCRVDPDHALLQLDRSIMNVLPRRPWPRIVLDLIDNDDRVLAAIGNRSIQITEAIIDCGDRVAVVGTTRSDPDGVACFGRKNDACSIRSERASVPAR